MQVLLAEDSEPAALAVKMALTRMGCEVSLALSGAEVMDRVNNNTYQIIFMDLELPDMTGLEVTKVIRALSSEEKSIVPIIALTGHMDKREVCLAAGMQDVLLKPADPSQLKSAIDQYALEKKSDTIIDWQGCVNILDGDKEGALEVLQMFAKGLNVSAIILGDALKNSNMKVLRDELHKLRGGICYLKLPILQQKLKEFHRVVRDDHPIQKDLEITYKNLTVAIKEFYEAYKDGKEFR